MPVVVVFDWKAWELGVSALKDPTHNFQNHDLVTLCKLITTILRAERFTEGFLPRKFEDGSVMRILDAIAAHIE